MLSVRPKIAELVLQLYGRSLHPELFEVYGTKQIQRGKVADLSDPTSAGADGYEATIQITSAGHVVTWRHGGLTLTEVCASSHQPLPQKRRLASHRIEGERTERVECRGGATYQVNFALETISPEAFRTYQDEFDLLSLQSASPDAEGASGLLHRFEASGRAAVKVGAVSYVDVQSRDRSLRIRAMHTFPDDSAIVRLESTFQLPD